MGINNHIIFGVIFIGLVSLYGIGGISNIQFDLQNAFATIGGAWPTLNSPNCNASVWSFFVNTQCISLSVSAPVFWIGALLGSFFNRINAVNTVVNDLVFAPWANGFGIPFAPVFFLALMAIIGLEIIRIFRGSSSGT